MVAKTVSHQERENGMEITMRQFLRPCLSTTLERRPPRRAPSREREATQEPSSGETDMEEVDLLEEREAKAGEE